jgi:hypothetical protein
MKKDSRFFILKFSVGFLLATFFSIWYCSTWMPSSRSASWRAQAQTFSAIPDERMMASYVISQPTGMKNIPPNQKKGGRDGSDV